MSKDLTFTAEVVKDGAYNKLRVLSKDYFNSRIQQSPLGKVSLTVSYKKQKRSIQANNFYWMYLGMIEEETGNDTEDLHEHFKIKHLKPRYATVKEHSFAIYPSTAKLSKNDFGEYIKEIEVETSILAPNPCEAGFMCGKRECDICSKEIKVEYPDNNLSDCTF